METIKLDLIPNGKMPMLHASQYDDGRQVRINLTENRQAYTLTGNEVLSLAVRKADNTLVTMDIANTYGGKSYVEFATTEQMCAVAGLNFGELTITNNGTKVGSLNFYFACEPSPEAGGLRSASEINNLNRQIDDYLDEVLPEQIEDVAEPIVRELVPEVVGDNYYDKEQTDAKIGEAVEDKVDEDTFNESLSNKYEQKLTQTLKVGENILTEASVVLGANWSGTLAGGFAHSSSSTEPLEFNVPTTSGKPYLVTFNATNVNGTVLYAKIGNTPNVDIYNGTTIFNVGIVSDGGNLVFTPVSSFNGTITNIKLREVQDEGDEVSFEVKNVNTKENSSGLSGFWNVALGFDSFNANENGSRNVALGYCSLQEFKSGTRNLALGTFAMNRLVHGDRNVAIGADSLWYATHARSCIAIGHNSMRGVGTDIENNIAIGPDSLGEITTGKNNVAIGSGAMRSPQTTNATGCVAIGYEAGYYSKTGNTNVGFRAGYYNRGIRNTTLGYQAGSQNYVSGDDNVFIGFDSGINNTGGTASNPKTASKSIALGQNAKVTKSNQMVLGSSDITEVVICGNKKINFNNDGTVTWETLT